jgi:protein-tyrosine phosphatase
VIPWPAGPGVVELPDGRRIRGRGLHEQLPEGLTPDFGLYLLGRDPGAFSWPHRWVRWPDFRLPTSTPEALDALAEAFRRAASERVEVACHGGVGRTGTSLAAIAVMAGIPSTEAVAWARERYHPRAVETPWQRRWVLREVSARD